MRLQNGTNRAWTTSEEADISCYEAPDIQVVCFDDYAVLNETVYVYALNNVYVVVMNPRMVWSTHLKDALDTAAELVWYWEEE